MKESLHRKLMLRIGGLLVGLIFLFFIIANIYFSMERKRSIIMNGRAVSTLILKKASENMERAGGNLLALTALSLELKRTVEGSAELTEIGFIDPAGKFVAHSSPEKIGTQSPEIFMEVTGEPKVISHDNSQYAIYPLTEEHLKGLKLAVGFSKSFQTSSKKYIGLQVIILLISIITAYAMSSAFIRSQVLNPLERLRRHSLQVKGGDLTHYAAILNYDEIGQLTEAFNATTESIRTIIEKISRVSGDMKSSADILYRAMGEVKNFILEQHLSFEEMKGEVKKVSESAVNIAEKMQELGNLTQESSTSAQEIATSLRQAETEVKNLIKYIGEIFESVTLISERINEINERNEILLTEIQETSASASEMSKSAAEVESLAREGSAVAVKAAEISKEGMVSAERTNDGMVKIMQIMDHIIESVKALEKRTVEIEKILTVIQNIAGQTNLLAINASIIASQAGEHGKSFAVVAEHIKNLASSTATSTRDIETIIKTVQKDVKKTVEIVSAGAEAVEEGRKLSIATLNILKKLEEASLKNAEAMWKVVQAMEEQTKGSKRVSDASVKISEHAQEIVRATREQAEAALNVKSVAEKMKNLSEEVMKASEEQTKAGANIMKLTEEIFKAISLIIESANAQKKELLGTAVKISRGTDIMGEITSRVEGVVKIVHELNLLSDSLLKEVKKFRLE
uniref:Methyl-accepting chemotaxis sensory transducer n=1 Tax=uncultured prokaryote TaxID=198431 RepID=H5SPZ6_9ZZZZ|nr:methyl-accepting chemotaxis sensory transducer [uncultured prokaryote]